MILQQKTDGSFVEGILGKANDRDWPTGAEWSVGRLQRTRLLRQELPGLARLAARATRRSEADLELGCQAACRVRGFDLHSMTVTRYSSA